MDSCTWHQSFVGSLVRKGWRVEFFDNRMSGSHGLGGCNLVELCTLSSRDIGWITVVALLSGENQTPQLVELLPAPALSVTRPKVKKRCQGGRRQDANSDNGKDQAQGDADIASRPGPRPGPRPAATLRSNNQTAANRPSGRRVPRSTR